MTTSQPSVSASTTAGGAATPERLMMLLLAAACACARALASAGVMNSVLGATRLGRHLPQVVPQPASIGSPQLGQWTSWAPPAPTAMPVAAARVSGPGPRPGPRVG